MASMESVFWTTIFGIGETSLSKDFVYYGGGYLNKLDCSEMTYKRHLRHYEYFQNTKKQNEVEPKYETNCPCGKKIKRNMFLKSKANGIIIVVGSCCYTKFTPEECRGKHCDKCGAKHKNITKNICNECREEYFRTIKFGKYKGTEFGEFFEMIEGKKGARKQNDAKSYIKWMKGLESKCSQMYELIYFLQN